MSDHLPVLLDLEFDPSQVSTQTADYNNLPCDEFIGLQTENYLLNKSTKIYNLQGSEIEAESLILSKKYGIYIIKHLCNNGDYIYRKMHITVSGDLLFSH
jgi:hypothetical protein